MSKVREVTGGGRLGGRLRPPGDKSISHRSLLLGAMAKGRTRVRGLLPSADVRATRRLVEALGARVTDEADGSVTVVGPERFTEPTDVIDAANSGTTARLGLGLLAGLDMAATLTGDGSLRGRPMRRVVTPLTKMGARFLGRKQGEYLPITVQGGALAGIDYELPIASGQVKGSLLLAGLSARGETVLRGRTEGRDHTERMFKAAGIELVAGEHEVRLKGPQRPQPLDGTVPGDPSSAAFFLVAGAIVPGSEVVIEDVGLNPGRLGVLRVLEAMGARVEREETEVSLGESRGTIRLRGGPLRGVKWDPSWAVEAIDEIPVLAVAACLAEGETEIHGAEELRVKESDRLATICGELRKLGAEIEELPDGLRVRGPQPLVGARVESHDDHRIAMAMAIAGLRAKGKTVIGGAEAVDISYPTFFEDLGKLYRG